MLELTREGGILGFLPKAEIANKNPPELQHRLSLSLVTFGSSPGGFEYYYLDGVYLTEPGCIVNISDAVAELLNHAEPEGVCLVPIWIRNLPL